MTAARDFDEARGRNPRDGRKRQRVCRPRIPEPEDELTKAQLTSHIRKIIKRRRLTQAAAAKLMGIDQPKVSALLNGRLGNFSSERLMRLLTALGQDVEITVRATQRGRAQGQVRVVGALAG